MIDIFIPSYRRANNQKTVNYFLRIGWDNKKIHVVVDNETDDLIEYQILAEKKGINLYVFDFKEERKKYDCVYLLEEKLMRTPGIARNKIHDIAREKDIETFCIIDDDTENFQIKPKSNKKITKELIEMTMDGMAEILKKYRIGAIALSQCGDMFSKERYYIFRKKLMNFIIYNTNYLYRGERGLLDDDTAQYVTLYNEGYFVGTLGFGLIYRQSESVTQKGGLTEIYKELKLLYKALNCVIQFPSAIIAEKQTKNGGRLHHRINYRYLMPKILKIPGRKSNIAFDCYEEDKLFTNQRRKILL